jgi:hypothetical protein
MWHIPSGVVFASSLDYKVVERAAHCNHFAQQLNIIPKHISFANHPPSFQVTESCFYPSPTVCQALVEFCLHAARIWRWSKVLLHELGKPKSGISNQIWIYVPLLACHSKMDVKSTKTVIIYAFLQRRSLEQACIT